MGNHLAATRQGSPITKQYYSHSPSLSVHCCCCCSPPRRLPSILSPPPPPPLLLRILCRSVVIFSLTFLLAFSSVEGAYMFQVNIPRQGYKEKYNFNLTNDCTIMDVFTSIEKHYGKEYDLFHTYLRWPGKDGAIVWPKVQMYYLSNSKVADEWVPYGSVSLTESKSIESVISLESDWLQPVDRMILGNCTRKLHHVFVSPMDLIMRINPLTVVMVTSTHRNIPPQSFFMPGTWSQFNINEVLKTYIQCVETVMIHKHLLVSLRVPKMKDKLAYNENIPLTIDVVPRVDAFSFSSTMYNSVNKLYNAVHLSVHRPMFTQSATLALRVDWRSRDLCIPQGPLGGVINHMPWIRLCYDDKVSKASVKNKCLCFRGLPTENVLEIGIKYATCKMMGPSFGRSIYFGESEDIVTEILLKRRRVPCVLTTWTKQIAKYRKRMPSLTVPYFFSSVTNETEEELRTVPSKELRAVAPKKRNIISKKASKLKAAFSEKKGDLKMTLSEKTVDLKATFSEKTVDLKATFSEKTDDLKAAFSAKKGNLKAALSVKKGNLKAAFSGQKNKLENTSEEFRRPMKLENTWTFEKGKIPELGILPFFESLDEAKERDDIKRECPDLCIHFEFVSKKSCPL